MGLRPIDESCLDRFSFEFWWRHSNSDSLQLYPDSIRISFQKLNGFSSGLPLIVSWLRIYYFVVSITVPLMIAYSSLTSMSKFQIKVDHICGMWPTSCGSQGNHWTPIRRFLIEMDQQYWSIRLNRSLGFSIIIVWYRPLLGTILWDCRPLECVLVSCQNWFQGMVPNHCKWLT